MSHVEFEKKGFKIMLVIQLLSSRLQSFLEEHQSQQPVNELWWFKVHGHHMVVKVTTFLKFLLECSMDCDDTNPFAGTWLIYMQGYDYW